jgi:pimeloyl-ACP methyl ester carboxylesterase
MHTCRKLGEKATWKVIPNSGHLPSQEEPKLFNRVLLELLLAADATRLQRQLASATGPPL